VAVALYRSLLRNAKILDRDQCFKVPFRSTSNVYSESLTDPLLCCNRAILTSDFQWRNRKKCDFFETDKSCVDKVRTKSRAKRAPKQVAKAIDVAMAVNKEVSQRVRWLYVDDN
jgi:hypothetical protein